METTILKRFDSPIEANIVKGMLEANDIFCFLQDEHSIGMNPLYSNALGGIKLMVRIEDQGQAQKILENNAAESKIICPACGSHDVHYVTDKKNKTNWVSVFVSLLLTILPLYLKKKHECSACGNVFETV